MDPRWLSAAAALGWLAAHGPQGAPPGPAHPPALRPLRYDEDYSSLGDPAARAASALALEGLKHVPLDPAGSSYLSLGGEVREEYERYEDRSLGASPRDDDGGYLLQRYVLHADLHAGERLRLFGQLYAAPASAENLEPSPADEDELRLQQAFADVLLRSGPDGMSALTLRAGRQELLYGSERLISVREGLNVRRSFDALRAFAGTAAWRVEALLGRPVEVDPRAFHDEGDPDQALWGVYATRPPGSAGGAGLDLYYLGLSRRDAAFSQGVADELRHTAGSRLSGRRGAWDYDLEAMLQLGRFDPGDIFAWSAAADLGYLVESCAPRPRLGLKASVISGDGDPGDPDLGTFNPLYPKGNYFGESTLIGPANLLHVSPTCRTELGDGLSLEAGWSFYWRYSAEDGVYGPAGNLVQPPGGSSRLYVGSEPSLSLSWQIRRELSLRLGCSHLFPGPFLEDAGRSEDLDYLSVTLAFRF